jgi:hypothetical protein
MSDDTRHLARPKTRPVFWLLLGLVALALVGLLIPLRSHPIIDKARLIDLETSQIRAALQTYEVTFGALPAGDSSAVFRALRGDNPQKIVFLQCRAESVSPDGGMLDPWGTPYRIYVSGKEPLVRSAGPNKQFDDSGRREFDDYIR